MSPSASTPSLWRRDTAARISAWSSRPSRGSGGSDREVARQPELAQMERGVPDALHQGVTAGDLVRRGRGPERLRGRETPGELRGGQRGGRPPGLAGEVPGGRGGGGCGGGRDGALPRP